jgi:uncharacterized protein with HEPN domain
VERFKKDKIRLFDIIKSIEQAEASLAAIKYEDFIKGTEAREGIASRLRTIGKLANQLSRDFQLSYGNIDWNFLLDLQNVAYIAQETQVDPYSLWYMVENDLPQIKDQLYEITAVIDDKGDDAFYI